MFYDYLDQESDIAGSKTGKLNTSIRNGYETMEVTVAHQSFAWPIIGSHAGVPLTHR